MDLKKLDRIFFHLKRMWGAQRQQGLSRPMPCQGKGGTLIVMSYPFQYPISSPLGTTGYILGFGVGDEVPGQKQEMISASP